MRLGVIFFQRCQPDRNGCQHSCVEEFSEAHCSCHEGFQLEVDKKSCRDVDECRSGLAKCAHNCINNLGSYECACRPGFVLAQDGLRCLDTNECLDQNGGCQQICNNSQGHYSILKFSFSNTNLFNELMLI